MAAFICASLAKPTTFSVVVLPSAVTVTVSPMSTLVSSIAR